MVLLGTAEFALPVLSALRQSPAFELVGVVSRPPRPAGRGRKLRQPPVARLTQEMGLPLLQPERAGDADFLEALRGLEPKVMVCVAYGLYMPGGLLELAPRGVVNVHPSPLPRHRGAAPIQRTIMEGCSNTALCFMLTDTKGWDTGPILRCYPHEVGPRETAGTLHDSLAALAGQRVEEVLSGYLSGRIAPTPQQGEPSYADKLDKSELLLDWNRSAEELDRSVRALSPWPGARTEFRGASLKVLSTALSEAPEGPPGTLSLDGEGFPVVRCGSGGLRLERVQPGSKSRMAGTDFLRGYGPLTGERLGGDSRSEKEAGEKR